MRKKHTPENKTKIVIEVLREERTLAEIASENGIHPNMISRWKNHVVNNMHTLFEDEKRKEAKAIKSQNETIQELYAQIGELSAKLNWLKKKYSLDI